MLFSKVYTDIDNRSKNSPPFVKGSKHIVLGSVIFVISQVEFHHEYFFGVLVYLNNVPSIRSRIKTVDTLLN